MRDLLTDIARWGGNGSAVATRTRSVVMAKGREEGGICIRPIFFKIGCGF